MSGYQRDPRFNGRGRDRGGPHHERHPPHDGSFEPRYHRGGGPGQQWDRGDFGRRNNGGGYQPFYPPQRQEQFGIYDGDNQWRDSLPSYNRNPPPPRTNQDFSHSDRGDFKRRSDSYRNESYHNKPQKRIRSSPPPPIEDFRPHSREERYSRSPTPLARRHLHEARDQPSPASSNDYSPRSPPPPRENNHAGSSRSGREPPPPPRYHSPPKEPDLLTPASPVEIDLRDSDESEPVIVPTESPTPARGAHRVEEVINLSETYPEYSAPVPPTFDSRACRLCTVEQVFKTDHDFATHLTIIHYRDRMMKDIRYPFDCKRCGFAPPENLDRASKAEEMLMHMGYLEGLAHRFYTEDLLAMPAQAETAQIVTEKSVCDICKMSFNTERLFVRHVCLRHFSEEICSELPKKEPFLCPYIDCDKEKETLHELTLHYGCEHYVAMEMYRKRQESESSGGEPSDKLVIDLNEPEVPLPVEKPVVASPTPAKPAYVPKRRPKTVPQPTPEAPKDKAVEQLKSPPASRSPLPSPSQQNTSGGSPLPPKPASLPPKKTPDLNKSSEKPSRERITKHSPSNQKKPVLIDMFSPTQKPAKPSSGDDLKCNRCRDSTTFANTKSLNLHLMQSHFFKDLPKSESMKCLKCPKTFSGKKEFFIHFLKNHFTEYLAEKDKERERKKIKRISSSGKGLDEANNKSDAENSLPKNRIRKTVHNSHGSSGELTARQRLMQKWENTSIDGSRIKIEELERTIKEMEEAHKEALQKKDEQFERWINQKEKALESEVKAKKRVEEKLSQLNVEHAGLQNELEQAKASGEKNLKAAEEKEEKYNLILKDKKALEKSVTSLVSKTSDLERAAEEHKEELKNIEGKIKEKVEEASELEITISEKDDEIKQLNSTHDFEKKELEKKLTRMEKQLEHHEGKTKKLIEEKKEKMAQNKELIKKNKEEENKLKEQITKLTKENKSLASKSAQEKRMEMKKLEKDQSRVEELEKSLSELESQNDILSTERGVLLDSLDRLQRIILDFENIIQEKNDKLKEATGKMEDAETNLEEAIQKIKDQKGVDKEKRELNRQVKQLQSTLTEWESRQFANAKLTAGLTKENNELKKKLKDFEENNTGTEDDLREMQAKVTKLEKDAAAARKSLQLADQEKAKAFARLESKNEEVDTLQSKNIEYQAKVLELEREVRQSSSIGTSNDNEKVARLQGDIKNNESEIQHLRMTLHSLKANTNQLRAENAQFKKELSVTTKRNENFESDYSMLVARYETVKASLLDHRKQLEEKHQRLIALQRNAPSQIVEPSTSSAFPVVPIKIKEERVDVEEMPEMPDMSQGIADTSSHCVDASASLIVLNMPASEIKTEPKNLTPVKYQLPKAPVPLGHLVQQRRSLDPDLSDFFPEDDRLPDLNFHDPGPAVSPSSSATLSCPSPRQFATHSAAHRPSPASSSLKSPPPNVPKDVTGAIDETDDIVCGICGEYDPPLPSEGSKGTQYTTEWVGCDCDRWFHKHCTKLKKFTNKFSCRSVKMKCLKKKN